MSTTGEAHVRRMTLLGFTPREKERGMAGGTELNWGKLKELILYLSQSSLAHGQDPGFGYVKLNKQLYRADTEAFRLLGASITGETYEKQDYGPVGRHVPIVLDELGAAGYLRWQFVERGEHTQKVPTATEPPDLAGFTKDELVVIDTALAELLPLGGKQVSEWSHHESAGWRVVSIGQEISYETSIISSAKPPKEAVEQLRQRVLSNNWD
jgi:hypothetical protein